MDYRNWANQQIERHAEPKRKTKLKEILAERLGMALSTLHVRLAGKGPDFDTDQVEIIAEAIGVESPARGRRANHARTSHAQADAPGNVISLRASTPTHTSARPQARAVVGEWITYPVLGAVEAGSFREVDMLAQVEPREHPGPRFSSYPNATPMAWVAHGDSMNNAYPYPIFDGTILFGVDFQETGGNLTNDMIVVVEQNRGGLIERSVKAVAIFPDRTEFQPRSTDPRHRPIIYKNGNRDDGIEVRVLTVILGTYNSLRN